MFWIHIFQISCWWVCEKNCKAFPFTCCLHLLINWTYYWCTTFDEALHFLTDLKKLPLVSLRSSGGLNPQITSLQFPRKGFTILSRISLDCHKPPKPHSRVRSVSISSLYAILHWHPELLLQCASQTQECLCVCTRRYDNLNGFFVFILQNAMDGTRLESTSCPSRVNYSCLQACHGSHNIILCMTSKHSGSRNLEVMDEK